MRYHDCLVIPVSHPDERDDLPVRGKEVSVPIPDTRLLARWLLRTRPSISTKRGFACSAKDESEMESVVAKLAIRNLALGSGDQFVDEETEDLLADTFEEVEQKECMQAVAEIAHLLERLDLGGVYATSFIGPRFELRALGVSADAMTEVMLPVLLCIPAFPGSCIEKRHRKMDLDPYEVLRPW